MHAPGSPVHLRSWLRAVGEIGRAAGAGEPVDALLGRVAAQACALLGVDHCAVLLADGEPRRLHMAGSSGLNADVAVVSGNGSPAR